MKVLHVTPSFAPAWRYGGPTESVFELCRHLPATGAVVRVLTTNAHGLEEVLETPTDREIELERGLSVFYCRRLFRHSVSVSLLRHLSAYVRWADIVHLTAVYSFPTIPTLLASRLFSRPVLWSPRGALQRWDQSSRVWAKALWEAVCKIARPRRLALHATGDAEGKACRERFPEVEVRVVSNGVSVPDIGSERTTDCSALRILYFGRFDPLKGVDNLLRACSWVDADLAGAWRLSLVGNGTDTYTAELRSMISELGLSGKVSLRNGVWGEAKHDLFANHDVLVLPSHSESFGMVVAEALAHAVPAIASTGTPWQRLEEVGCGLWVDNAPGSLGKAIVRMASAPRSEMGQRGREWMLREFSWDDHAAEIHSIYSSLVGSSQAAE